MNANPELLILSGLPGSGKSKRAREWRAEDSEHRQVINWDGLRLDIFGENWKFNRKDEEYMKALSHTMCVEWLAKGYSVCIDNTNLTERARSKWRNIAKEISVCPVTVTEEEIDTPVNVCVLRDHKREGRARVGQAVIDRMALTCGFIDWCDPSVYHPSACGKDFVIVDVDGTIADCEHRRHYVQPHSEHQSNCFAKNVVMAQGTCPCGAVRSKKDWPTFFKECVNDLPIQPVLDLVHLLSKKYYVLIVSGRPMDLCGKSTEDWLLKYQVPYMHLFMRDNGDSRDDTIVKHEIAELLPLERVAYVIDDRPKVLRMWRELGLTTLAVGDLKEF